jgi:hypothetical protein
MLWKKLGEEESSRFHPLIKLFACNMDGKQCTFYIEKKKRFCSFMCKPGTDKCGNHPDEQQGSQRVPCPIDPQQ